MTGVEVSNCLFYSGETGGEQEAGTETHPQLFALLPRLGISVSFKSQKGDFRVKHSLGLGQVVGLQGPGHSN